MKRSDKTTSTSQGSTGTKTFEYPFIPRSSGTFEIEPVDFSFYSISRKKYVTLSSKPLRIGVARGEETSAAVIAGGVNKQSVKSLGSDIRFISNNSSSLSSDSHSLITSYVFGLYMWAVAIIFLVLCFVFDKTIQRRKDVAGTRNRKAKKVAKARLKKAEMFLKQDLYSAFYEEMHKAILGYVSDKFTLPQAELNKETIGQKLADKGASPDLVNQLFEVLDACEFARYAPSSGNTAMENHYKQALKVISEIES